MRTQCPIPPINRQNHPQRVHAARERDRALGKGRHAAKGVREGGVGEEVGVEGLLLLVGRALAEGRDDAGDFFD